MPPTLTRLTVSDKIIIYMHAMRQTNAIIKCNKPTGVYTTAFSRSRRLGHPIARPALIPSLWHPASEKLERPVFQPRDQGEVFWNTALLSIEQTSFLLLPEYDYKVSDITMNNIGMATLRHPQLLYASSRTTRSSGKTTGSGTTMTVVNSTPQGLWLGRLS